MKNAILFIFLVSILFTYAAQLTQSEFEKEDKMELDCFFPLYLKQQNLTSLTHLRVKRNKDKKTGQFAKDVEMCKGKPDQLKQDAKTISEALIDTIIDICTRLSTYITYFAGKSTTEGRNPFQMIQEENWNSRSIHSHVFDYSYKHHGTSSEISKTKSRATGLASSRFPSKKSIYIKILSDTIVNFVDNLEWAEAQKKNNVDKNFKNIVNDIQTKKKFQVFSHSSISLADIPTKHEYLQNNLHNPLISIDLNVPKNKCYANFKFNVECPSTCNGNLGFGEMGCPNQRVKEARKVELKDIQNYHLQRHPSTREFGLFASKDLIASTVIGEYCGDLVDAKDFQNVCFSKRYTEKQSISSLSRYNMMRYAKMDCSKSNAVLNSWIIDKVDTLIVVLSKDIKKGDEILLDYRTSIESCFCKNCKP